MNDKLDQQSIDALVTYRIQRADETISEIPYLTKQGFYNTALNRLYYACYYAATALLIKNNISTTTHAGVKQMIELHFVSKGIISKEANRHYTILFDRRQSGDYDDFSYATEQEIIELTPKAQTFIDSIKQLI